MVTERKRRAFVLVGAGASLEFGAPSTSDLTEAIGREVGGDAWMRQCGGDRAYVQILETLGEYLQGGPCVVNFEHVFHCAHELLVISEPTAGAVNEYRPVLWPFIHHKVSLPRVALQGLVTYMATLIFRELSAICEKPKADIGLLRSFLCELRREHVTRIYTTNYDDFLLQAAPDLYTGFDREPNYDGKLFDRQSFWQATDIDCVFHLHGSVHMAFGRSMPPEGDLGDLLWFDTRAAALQRSSNPGSGERRMDGGQIVRTALTTGLDKFSRLQQRPFAHYYASMARDAMMADIIYVIGYGLGDLHLNIWLAEARRTKPVPPLIFVDWWPNDFIDDTAFESDRKTGEMVHTLHMLVSEHYGGDRHGSGWTLAKDRTCAIWDKGFLAFLKTPGELNHVLQELA